MSIYKTLIGGIYLCLTFLQAGVSINPLCSDLGDEQKKTRFCAMVSPQRPGTGS